MATLPRIDTLSGDKSAYTVARKGTETAPTTQAVTVKAAESELRPYLFFTNFDTDPQAAFERVNIHVDRQAEYFQALSDKFIALQEKINTGKPVTDIDRKFVSLYNKNISLQKAFNDHRVSEEARIKQVLQDIKEGKTNLEDVQKAHSLEPAPFNLSKDQLLSEDEANTLMLELRITALEYMAAGGYYLDTSQAETATKTTTVETRGRFGRKQTQSKTERSFKGRGKLIKTQTSADSPANEYDPKFKTKTESAQIEKIYRLIEADQRLRATLRGVEIGDPRSFEDNLSRKINAEVQKILVKEHNGMDFASLAAQDYLASMNVEYQAMQQAFTVWGDEQAKAILASEKTDYIKEDVRTRVQAKAQELTQQETVFEAYPPGTTQSQVDHNNEEIKAGRPPTLTRSVVNAEEVSEIKRNEQQNNLITRLTERENLEKRIKKIGDVTTPEAGTELYPLMQELDRLTNTATGRVKDLGQRIQDIEQSLATATDPRAITNFNTALNQLRQDMEALDRRKTELEGLIAALKNEKGQKVSDLAVLNTQIGGLESRGIDEKKVSPSAEKTKKNKQIKETLDASTIDNLNRIQADLLIKAYKDQALSSLQAFREFLGIKDYDILSDKRLRQLFAEMLNTPLTGSDVIDDVEIRRKFLKKKKELAATDPLYNYTKAQTDGILTAAEVAQLTNADAVAARLLTALNTYDAYEISKLTIAILHERLEAAAHGTPTEDFGLTLFKDRLSKHEPEKMAESTNLLRQNGIIEGLNAVRFADGINLTNTSGGISHYEIITVNGETHVYVTEKNDKGKPKLTDLGLLGIVYNGTTGTYEIQEGLNPLTVDTRMTILSHMYLQKAKDLKKAGPLQGSGTKRWFGSYLEVDGGKQLFLRSDRKGNLVLEDGDPIVIMNYDLRRGGSRDGAYRRLSNYLKDNPSEFNSTLIQEAGKMLAAQELTSGYLRTAETALAGDRGTLDTLTIGATETKLEWHFYSNGSYQMEMIIDPAGNIAFQQTDSTNPSDWANNTIFLTNGSRESKSFLGQIPIGTDRILPAGTPITAENAAKKYRERLRLSLYNYYETRATPEARRNIPFLTVQEKITYKDASGNDQTALFEIIKGSDGEFRLWNTAESATPQYTLLSDFIISNNMKKAQWSTTWAKVLEQAIGRGIMLGLVEQARHP